jgi:hypothetical protein
MVEAAANAHSDLFERGQATTDKFTTALSLARKFVDGKPGGNFTLHVDATGARNWLKAHGVPNACLAYQFGFACGGARPFASCGSKNEQGHTAEKEGAHKIADGWSAAAVKFVKPADKALLKA